MRRKYSKAETSRHGRGSNGSTPAVVKYKVVSLDLIRIMNNLHTIVHSIGTHTGDTVHNI